MMQTVGLDGRPMFSACAKTCVFLQCGFCPMCNQAFHVVDASRISYLLVTLGPLRK